MTPPPPAPLRPPAPPDARRGPAFGRAAAGSSAEPLTLADAAVALPAPGALHVFGRRGLVTLRANGVERLHARLAPHLSGALTEEQLLRAVSPAQASAVRDYLDGLRRAGALGGGGAARDGGDDVEAIEALGPECPRASFRAGGVRVEVRLDGPLASGAEGTLRICFVSPAQAASLLGSAGRAGGWGGRLTLVLVDAPGADGGWTAEAARRAAYARWLLRNEVDVLAPADRLRLFRLEAGGALVPVAAVEGAAASRRTLAAQLGALRWAEVDQAPLVVAEAGDPLSGEAGVRGAGVSAARVWPRMLRAWAARLLLDGGGPDPSLPFRTGPPNAPADGSPAGAARGCAAELVRADTGLELRLELATRWAEQRGGGEAPAWRAVDLLREPARGAAAYLQEVLRLRMDRLAGEVAVSAFGVHRCRAGAHAARALAPAAALGPVLLAAVCDAFYAEAPAPGLACGPLDFAPAAELRRRLAALEPGAPPAAVARLEAWGVPVWVGAPVSGDAW